MKTIYFARFVSHSFTFEAFGATRAKALAALRLGLAAHGKQYGLPTWWHRKVGDCEVSAFDLGVGYRDGEPITTDREQA